MTASATASDLNRLAHLRLFNPMITSLQSEVTAARRRADLIDRYGARSLVRATTRSHHWRRGAETHGSQASTSDGSIAAAGISRGSLASGDVEASCHSIHNRASPSISPEAHSGSCPSAGGSIEEVVGMALKGLAAYSQKFFI
jgi:hypothetical protein